MAITKKQFNTLEDLFDFYNEALFDNELPPCLVNLSRHKGAHGFFAADSWMDGDSGQSVHEISLNPDTMDRNPIEWQSTLVHEMAHLWEYVNGTASRKAYHNKVWARKMIMLGLMPSDTGLPGGKMTGQRMTHYIIDDGPFAVAFSQVGDLAHLTLPYTPTPIGEPEKAKKSAANKVKYACPCGCIVWGKAGLHIHCNDCDDDFVREELPDLAAAFALNQDELTTNDLNESNASDIPFSVLSHNLVRAQIQ